MMIDPPIDKLIYAALQKGQDSLTRSIPNCSRKRV